MRIMFTGRDQSREYHESSFEVSYTTSIEIFRMGCFSSSNTSDSLHVSIRHVPQVKSIPGLVAPAVSATLLRMGAIPTSLDLEFFTFVRVFSRLCSEPKKKNKGAGVWGWVGGTPANIFVLHFIVNLDSFICSHYLDLHILALNVTRICLGNGN